MNIPKINIGGDYPNITHLSQMLPLPAQTPYGNLYLKWGKIVSRLIRLNRLIEAAYRLHSQAISQTEPVLPSPIDELSHLLEEIVYWIRKSADELIGLSFLCEALLQKNALPTKVEVDCIGGLLQGDHQSLRDKYAGHLEQLQTLNNVSNAYKHSFINSDLNIIGRDEPVLFALGLLRNDLNKKEEFIGVALGEVVRGFDAFFQAAKEYLKRWPKSENQIVPGTI